LKIILKSGLADFSLGGLPLRVAKLFNPEIPFSLYPTELIKRYLHERVGHTFVADKVGLETGKILLDVNVFGRYGSFLEKVNPDLYKVTDLFEKTRYYAFSNFEYGEPLQNVAALGAPMAGMPFVGGFLMYLGTKSRNVYSKIFLLGMGANTLLDSIQSNLGSWNYPQSDLFKVNECLSELAVAPELLLHPVIGLLTLTAAMATAGVLVGKITHEFGAKVSNYINQKYQNFQTTEIFRDIQMISNYKDYL
jgi:hypothetical protein